MPSSWACTMFNTIVVSSPSGPRSGSGLATGAGLEPASPACTGALTVELPRSSTTSPGGTAPNGKLVLSDAVGHLAASPLSDAVGHTEGVFLTFRMSDAVGRGVLRGGTGFCFFGPHET